MALTQTSIKEVVAYLDPHVETLATGFPSSTRPNEPVLTREQKREKIEATLTNDPGVFLTKWGSVILYPRPVSPLTTGVDSYTHGDGPSPVAGDGLTAKGVLDLFAPLAVNYEVKYQLTKLYQQLQQLSEHADFEASRRQPSESSNTSASITAPSDMDIEPPQDPSLPHSKDIAPGDRKLDPGQNDLFARSIVSEKTRRNRRLNYLLRHLAPPDPSQISSSGTSSAKGRRSGMHAMSHSSGGSSERDTLNSQHPTLASILSISGSLSNLSFEDSTYFSDAEMQARAPELYQQYIGRFMDNDNDDNDDDEDDEADSHARSSDTVESDEDEQRRRPRRQKQALDPFGKDVGLVDRILWSVDHPTLSQQQGQHQRKVQVRYRSSGESTVAPTQHKQQQQRQPSQQATCDPSSAQTSVSASRVQAVNEQEDLSEFEEEFDTESEDEDSKMTGIDKPNDGHGPSSKDITNGESEILFEINVTSSIPSDLTPESISSTITSDDILLEDPEERTLLDVVEHGHPTDSDEDKELDQATANRKEDQEALRQEFVLLMKQRFLDGLDRTFDYSVVDFDENLDDLEQENNDEEDRWFDDEDEEGMDDRSVHKTLGAEISSMSRSTTRVAHTIRARMALDERLLVWEGSAQNGSGDYDY